MIAAIISRFESEAEPFFGPIPIDRPDPIEIPATFEEFNARFEDLERDILRLLAAIRTLPLADTEALPSFVTLYYAFRALLGLVLKVDQAGVDHQVAMFGAGLHGLGIKADRDGLYELLNDAARDLRMDDSTEIRFSDMLSAFEKVTKRVLRLWADMPKVEEYALHLNYAPHYSCFVSYSSEDEGFAAALVSRLKDAGVETWWAEHDMRGGRTIRDQISRGIDGSQKLLLVLSEASMKSEWVKSELLRAIETSDRTGETVLFPIRLVGMDVVDAWECPEPGGPRDLARIVRDYFIVDMTGWRDQERFVARADRLIDDLRRAHDDDAVESERP